MTENKFIFSDRIQKIQQIVSKYGEENFYISFSGGKDSTVLSALIDMAIPDNKIPRVYADTGIELTMIRDFVLEMQKTDDRVVVIKPSVPIKQMLEEEGYPFKSKEHSQRWREFSKGGLKLKHIQRYLGLYRRPNDSDAVVKRYMCPKKLQFQFTDEYISHGLKISDRCCVELKEEPLHLWQMKNNKPFGILGIIQEEKGRRNLARCLAFKKNGIMNFQPLTVVSKNWEDWFIEEYNVKICDIYREPYNFPRTGCKGCPFALNLQEELDTLEKYFPAERKQCEIIWGTVYAEYRRIGYRLRPDENIEGQISLEDYLKERGVK